MEKENNEKAASTDQRQPLTWLDASTRMVGSLAWPVTIFVLLLLFRHEITTVLRGITKVEYPGGSITVQLDRISAEVARSEPTQLQQSAAADLAQTSLSRSEGDPRAALTRVRFDLEQELFRPSEIGLSPPVTASTTASRRIDDLVEKGLIETPLARNARDFLQVVNDVTQGGKSYSEAELRRAVVVGANLVTEVRRRILGAELESHLAHNLLWLHTERPELFLGGMRSAVAASAPEFEYDYDIYRDTIDRFNRNEASRAKGKQSEQRTMKALSLEEFVRVLEFRERELMRVLEQERKPPKQREADYQYWKWPKEWGETGWNGPILRRDQSAESDLRKLRVALAIYKKRLSG